MYCRTRALAAEVIGSKTRGRGPRLALVFVLAFASLSLPAWSADSHGDAAAPSRPVATPAVQESLPAQTASTGVELAIRFYDKRVYHIGDGILLKLTLTNKGAQTWRFKLAEDRVYSLGMEARTPSNRALGASDSYKRSLAALKPVFYREVAINPGEEYSFVEELARYVEVKEAGSYTLRASFWPELISQAPGSSPVPPLASNALILSLLPPLGLPPATALVSSETGEVMRPLPLPPDEVVARTLEARQRSRWSEFFLYLDIESLLSRNESRKRAYDRESDEGRRRMIERYKTDLQANVVDVDVVTIPSTFEILETRYSADRGYVKVIEKFAYRGFTMVKEYDYELARRDGIWFIEAYTVLNKGTE